MYLLEPFHKKTLSRIYYVVSQGRIPIERQDK